MDQYRFDGFDVLKKVSEKRRDVLKERSQRDFRHRLESIENAGEPYKAPQSYVEMLEEGFKKYVRIMVQEDQRWNERQHEKEKAIKRFIADYQSVKKTCEKLHDALSNYHHCQRALEKNDVSVETLRQISEYLPQLQQKVKNLISDKQFPLDARTDIKEFLDQKITGMKDARKGMGELSENSGHRREFGAYSQTTLESMDRLLTSVQKSTVDFPRFLEGAGITSLQTIEKKLSELSGQIGKRLEKSRELSDNAEQSETIARDHTDLLKKSSAIDTQHDLNSQNSSETTVKDEQKSLEQDSQKLGDRIHKDTDEANKKSNNATMVSKDEKQTVSLDQDQKIDQTRSEKQKFYQKILSSISESGSHNRGSPVAEEYKFKDEHPSFAEILSERFSRAKSTPEGSRELDEQERERRSELRAQLKEIEKRASQSFEDYQKAQIDSKHYWWDSDLRERGIDPKDFKTLGKQIRADIIDTLKNKKWTNSKALAFINDATRLLDNFSELNDRLKKDSYEVREQILRDFREQNLKVRIINGTFGNRLPIIRNVLAAMEREKGVEIREPQKSYDEISCSTSRFHAFMADHGDNDHMTLFLREKYHIDLSDLARNIQLVNEMVFAKCNVGFEDDAFSRNLDWVTISKSIPKIREMQTSITRVLENLKIKNQEELQLDGYKDLLEKKRLEYKDLFKKKRLEYETNFELQSERLYKQWRDFLEEPADVMQSALESIGIDYKTLSDKAHQFYDAGSNYRPQIWKLNDRDLYEKESEVTDEWFEWGWRDSYSNCHRKMRELRNDELYKKDRETADKMFKEVSIAYSKFNETAKEFEDMLNKLDLEKVRLNKEQLDKIRSNYQSEFDLLLKRIDEQGKDLFRQLPVIQLDQREYNTMQKLINDKRKFSNKISKLEDYKLYANSELANERVEEVFIAFSEFSETVKEFEIILNKVDLEKVQLNEEYLDKIRSNYQSKFDLLAKRIDEQGKDLFRQVSIIQLDQKEYNTFKKVCQKFIDNKKIFGNKISKLEIFKLYTNREVAVKRIEEAVIAYLDFNKTAGEFEDILAKLNQERHKIMSKNIRGLQRKLQQTVQNSQNIELTEDIRKQQKEENDYYWKSWRYIQESEALVEYETQEIKEWRKKETDRLITRDLEMWEAAQKHEGKIRDENGNIKEELSEDDVNNESIDSMKKYWEQEMEFILAEIEKRAEAEKSSN